MRQAWIVRPDWSVPQSFIDVQKRLRPMPLQHLELLPADPSLLAKLQAAACPWVVFTSPGSVHAFAMWSAQTGIHVLRQSAVRIAAVGSGTRDQLITEAAQQSQGVNPWRIDSNQILIADDADRADAQGLLAAFDGLAQREGLDWRRQTLLLAEAEGNRPILRGGFSQRGAQVLAARMYRRVDTQWPAAAWQELASTQPGEIGLVVSSSALARRLVELFHAHHLALTQAIWCTHHISIAQQLRTLGVEKIRRVRLGAYILDQDLFEHEHYW